MKVELGEQGSRCGDLVALGVDGDLAEYDPGVVVERGDQVRGTPVRFAVAGAADGLAVQGDHAAPAGMEGACT
nr:hypothetical protein [Tomitella gaofuii]